MKDPCEGCIYLHPLGSGYDTSTGNTFCGYILDTGRRRPCPAGKGCTVKQTEADRIDWAAAREAYDRGALDREIAKAAGCCLSWVSVWRKRNNLPSNYKLRAAANKEKRRLVLKKG